MFTPQQEERIKEIVQETLKEQTRSQTDESVVEFFETIPDMNNYYVSTTYELYEDYCKARGIKPLSKIAFGSNVSKYYNLKSKTTTVNGKSVRVYTR